MTQRRIHSWTDVQTTTGAATATFTDPTAYQIPSNSAARMVAQFIGRDTTGQLSVSFKVTANFKNVAGTRTVDGTPVLEAALGNALLTTATGTAVQTGSNQTPQATGVATYTIEWFCHVTLWVT